ncbi:MAG: hypothetical protein KAH05_05255 [Clostridiales bacterium]|nr:hypothetical protein [Clostridiales bacterium]
MPKESSPVVKGYVNDIGNYEEMINYLTNEMMRIKESGLDIGEYKIEINELMIKIGLMSGRNTINHLKLEINYLLFHRGKISKLQKVE